MRTAVKVKGGSDDSSFRGSGSPLGGPRQVAARRGTRWEIGLRVIAADGADISCAHL